MNIGNVGDRLDAQHGPVLWNEHVQGAEGAIGADRHTAVFFWPSDDGLAIPAGEAGIQWRGLGGAAGSGEIERGADHFRFSRQLTLIRDENVCRRELQARCALVARR